MLKIFRDAAHNRSITLDRRILFITGNEPMNERGRGPLACVCVCSQER